MEAMSRSAHLPQLCQCREMKLSTRNQLRGTVLDVHHGESISTIKVELGGGDVVTSAITREAADDLNLTTGMAVVVLVKATEVSLGVED